MMQSPFNHCSTYLKLLAAVALTSLVLGCSPQQQEEQETVNATATPNVLIIAVDDLNDWVGYTGTHPDTITPNIDALAARGTVFTQAYSQFPLCGPSRASLFAGMLPSSLGLLKQPRPDSVVAEAAAKHDSLLLHSYFREHGYKTMAVGKLLHEHIPEDSVDLSGGRGDWDRMVDNERINFDSDNTMTDWAVYPYPEAEMSDPTAAVWAVERLQETHDQPFLLMVGFLRPHVPWYVPEQYFDAVGDADALTLPPYRADDLDDVPSYAQRMNVRDGYPRTNWAIDT
ncbi:MAG: sulfatase-like hydrolase/transferase, partial [Woeseiaceae bacterium]